jgi:hypothetical protein
MSRIMAELKFPTLEELGRKGAEWALDEFEYNGHTIREWADKITVGEYQPVKHGGTVNLWVSCSERMPETPTETLDGRHSDCCLVFAEETEWIGMAYYRTNNSESWWEFADAQNKPKIDWAEITHWMPLPNIPTCGAKMDGGTEDEN